MFLEIVGGIIASVIILAAVEAFFDSLNRRAMQRGSGVRKFDSTY